MVDKVYQKMSEIKIVRRADGSGKVKFFAIKSFYHDGERHPGDILELEGNTPETSGCFQLGRVIPCDWEDPDNYISLHPLSIFGEKGRYDCAIWETISLRLSDALPLVKQGSIIPADDTKWRPNNRRLMRINKK
jgi:hypothetical protein